MYPIAKYRPVRTSDGQGGFTESLGRPRTIYGVVQVHAPIVKLIVDKNEDVKMEDMLNVTEGGAAAWYHVSGRLDNLGGQWAQYKLEREDRPIVPD